MVTSSFSVSVFKDDDGESNSSGTVSGWFLAVGVLTSASGVNSLLTLLIGVISFFILAGTILMMPCNKTTAQLTETGIIT